MNNARLLALVFSFSMNAGAANLPLFPVLACPAMGDEHEKLISKLDSIKTSIREGANCNNVRLKVSQLEELVTDEREKILALVAGSEGSPLSVEQSSAVRSYAENVTKKVAALNDLFTQSNYCFKEDNANQQLSALAGFVGEAANMIGALSGPWGTPIALAGNVVAGFLTGLDEIFKSRAGYDFSRREQWVSYVQNLCTYHSYREQVEHLLNPKVRLAQLQSLKSKLDFQIQIMSRNCGECRAIESGYETNQNRRAPELWNQLSHLITTADQQNAKPYGSYMIQSLGLRDWALDEMKRVQKESRTYWADATGRHILTQAKNEIEQFLIEQQAPKFLSHGIAQSHADIAQFTYLINGEGRQVYTALERGEAIGPRRIQSAWSDPVELFRVLIIQPVHWDKIAASVERDELQFVWTHFRDQSLDRFRTALASTQVVQSFCSFFKHSGFYSPSIRNQCGSSRFRRHIQEQEDLMNELVSASIDLGPLNGAFKSEEKGAPSMTPIESILREIEMRGIGQ